MVGRCPGGSGAHGCTKKGTPSALRARTVQKKNLRLGTCGARTPVCVQSNTLYECVTLHRARTNGVPQSTLAFLGEDDPARGSGVFGASSAAAAGSTTSDLMSKTVTKSSLLSCRALVFSLRFRLCALRSSREIFCLSALASACCFLRSSICFNKLFAPSGKAGAAPGAVSPWSACAAPAAVSTSAPAPAADSSPTAAAPAAAEAAVDMMQRKRRTQRGRGMH